MLKLEEREIRSLVDLRESIDVMREAVVAQAQGQTEAPLPLHFEMPGFQAEVHVRASHLKGGELFVLKMWGSFPLRGDTSRSQSNGVVVLYSARTGDPIASFADHGYLTDVRTAAAAAMTVRELGRNDSSIGILGAGFQARMQAVLHAEVLPLSTIWIWGRTPGRVEAFARDLATLVPGVEVRPAGSAKQLAREVRLLVTVTPSRAPILFAGDLRPGTHVSAVGADAPGKQELDPQVLRDASLLLVDSVEQGLRMGELQHAKDEAERAVEVGRYCVDPVPYDRNGVSVADFTGLGVEDLFITDYCYRKKGALR